MRPERRSLNDIYNKYNAITSLYSIKIYQKIILVIKKEKLFLSFKEWGEEDSNLRRRCQRVYSPPPLATRVSPLINNIKIFVLKIFINRFAYPTTRVIDIKKAGERN